MWIMVLGLALPVLGKNVDLSTVPKRDTVELTIYNSEDLTLVRETRVETFKKGANPLQFSWVNTLIDPTSVGLRFLTSPDRLEVSDTTFPHDKPQMLYWNVSSEIDGEATVEITYFTSGISWSADYVALADKDETSLGLEGFVRVSNRSGEEYENAHIRLVVGTINLVEKIAQLAHVSMDDVKELKSEMRHGLKLDAAKKSLELSEAAAGAMANSPEKMPREKEIIKEGLSEYFIFSIDGTESIPNGWSKRMRSLDAKNVPFKIQYRYRPAEYGEQLVRMYILTNDKDSKLGTTPLPDGAMRLFRDNGRDGLSYVAAQSLKYIPIGDKIEVNLGADPNVIFELIKLRSSRANIWMQINGADIFRQVGAPGVVIDVNSSVAGWDDREVFTQRVRNYSSKAVDVEVRRNFPGHVVFRSGLNPVLHDYQTVQFSASVAAGKKSDLRFETVRHQGHNAKQNNVTLEKAEIAP